MTSVALAIDLGGTNLRGAVITSTGQILVRHSRKTRAHEGPDAVIQRIDELIQELAEEADLEQDVAVGIAAPGPLDPYSGIVHFAPNLPGWIDIPLRDRLAALTNRRIYIGNDGNAAALGEYYFGRTKEVRHLIYVALGTGFGGGVISNGGLVDGKRGLGAEIGHIPVALTGPRCSCGSIGHVEAFCSGWAIARDARLLVETGRGDAIAAASESGLIDARAVRSAAERDDPAAKHILHSAGWALGAGLASFVNIFNPEMIVIGGGLADIGDFLMIPARESLQLYAIPAIAEDVQITYSNLDTRTGIYGAAALVFHDML